MKTLTQKYQEASDDMLNSLKRRQLTREEKVERYGYIREFLKEEYSFYNNNYDSKDETWLKNHDTLLINFILSEVEREVERLGEEKDKNIAKNELDYKNPMWNVNQSGYRQAISDQITHLQAQIKELESIKN